MLGHLGMHPEHLLPRTGYLKNEIPIAGCRSPGGHSPFRDDPATSVLDVNCKAHEVDNLYVVDTSASSQHRGGEPGPHRDGQRAAGGRPPARATRLRRRGCHSRQGRDRHREQQRDRPRDRARARPPGRIGTSTSTRARKRQTRSRRSRPPAARPTSSGPTSRGRRHPQLVDGTVAAFGRLDILVNNAGMETRTSTLDTTERQFDMVIAIDLKSAFFGVQLAASR